MGSERLTPRSTAYLQSLTRYQNFIKKSSYLTVNTSNFTANTDIPTVSTFGDGEFFITGSVTAGSGAIAGSVIGTLPSYVIPLKDTYLPITVTRAGADIFNAVKVNLEGDSVASVTVTTPGSYATLPTASVSTPPGTGAVLAPTMEAVTSTVVSAGTGYAPNNTITLTGSTGTEPVLTVATTQVVSATIVAGGTGGTPGTQTVTGTTGTGTKFQASVTVNGGGIITAVLSISVNGSYTVNPTTITDEPVTGAGLSGATLSVVMGVATATPTTPGACTALAASPVAQGSTSGSGTGATFTVLWGLLSIAVVDQGSGYNTASTIVIAGGGGTGGGAATLTLDAVNNLQLRNAATTGDIIHLDSIRFISQPYY